MERERNGFPQKEVAKWANDFGQAARERMSDVATTVKVRHEQAKEHAAEAKLEKERKLLKPVFATDFESADFSLPSLICVVEEDDKHKRSVVCKDSVGFLQNTDEMQILNLYPGQAEQLNLKLLPSYGKAAFFVDNTQKNLYINLDEYFEYQKKARIDELEQIAFCLGAKHVEARLIEKEKNTDTIKGKVSGKKGKVGKVETDIESKKIEASVSEVALCTDFDGNSVPTRPELRYFKHEASILNLIAMRLSTSENKVKAKTYLWDFSHSSGIQEKTAVKIESALKAAKMGVNGSLVKQAASEKRQKLEYKIVF